MTRSLRIVGIVLLLAVTGVVVILQINLRNELGDAREKLKALESKNGALHRDVRDANNAKGASEVQRMALQQQLSELEQDRKSAKEEANNLLMDTKKKLNERLQSAESETKKLKDQLSTCEKRSQDLVAENGKQEQHMNKELKAAEEESKTCASSKVDLETQLSALKHELTKVQIKSEELNGKLDRYQKQVADLKSKAQQCNTMLTSLKTKVRKCEVLSTTTVTTTTSAPTTQAHGVSHRPESNKGIKGQTTDLSKAPDTPKDEDNQQADDSPLPYRGNPGIIGDLKNEDGGVELDYPDGNEQDENEEGDGDEGLNADKKPDDDLMEKVFHDEQQRRLNLLGNSDHSEIKS